jgi:predicted Zn-dependent protease
MNRVVAQGLTIVVLFFLAWLSLSKIDWITILQVQKATDKTEKKLGDLFWEIIQKSEKQNKDRFTLDVLDSVVSKICNANDIDRQRLKLHVIEKDEVNAFALPNGHLVIYTGLILNSESAEELSGVICHEIAHVQLNHVMKKLGKEVGLSVLISMTTGQGQGEMIKETVKMLSSSAFDRQLEKDADIAAADFLMKANVNPEAFANFLFRYSQGESESAKYLTWASTHPESRERAEYIIEYSRDRHIDYTPILAPDILVKVKERIKE